MLSRWIALRAVTPIFEGLHVMSEMSIYIDCTTHSERFAEARLHADSSKHPSTVNLIDAMFPHSYESTISSYCIHKGYFIAWEY